MTITFIIFGVVGMTAEVVFGAIKALFRDRSYELKGSTSLWMFFIYGLIAFIYPVIAVRIGDLPWWGRGLIYMIAIYIVEYISGWILRKLTVCPWNYPQKWSISGLVYLPYAPLWFGFGLGVEWLWPRIKAISFALS